MFSKALTAVVLAGVALAQTFSINTPPSIQQCQPAALSWTGGTGPYILSAIPQGQVSAAALTTISSGVTGTSYSWTVNLAQGTAITIRISDSTGALAYSSGITVQAGSSGCLGSASSGASAASTSSGAVVGSASSSGASAASTTSAAAVTTTTSRSASAASTTTTAAASTTTTSGTAAAQSSTSRAASSGAAGSKAEFNLPVLALAGVAGFAVMGGAIALF